MDIFLIDLNNGDIQMQIEYPDGYKYCHCYNNPEHLARDITMAKGYMHASDFEGNEADEGWIAQDEVSAQKGQYKVYAIEDLMTMDPEALSSRSMQQLLAVLHA